MIPNTPLGRKISKSNAPLGWNISKSKRPMWAVGVGSKTTNKRTLGRGGSNKHEWKENKMKISQTSHAWDSNPWPNHGLLFIRTKENKKRPKEIP